MKFSPALLDEIRARLPVSAVVGKRVKLKKQGREWAGLSPFNAEKTPSFFVNDIKGFYHCFSSGHHGDIFKFLMETEGLGFPEAVERLAGEAGVTLPKQTSEDREREDQRATLHEVMEFAAAFFESRLQAREGAAARGYLADRGLTPAIQAEFRLGYALGERYSLRDHLAGKGVSRDAMIEAGLLVHGEGIEVPYDRFRDRVIFPIADARGKIIAFGGRAMEKDAQAKYLNSPETPLFHKGACLYNHHKARVAAHAKGTVIAVEGYVDAIMMSVAGFQNVVAPLGTALTDDQLQLLWRMGEEPILCFDGDKAGRKAAYRAVDTALPHAAAGRSLKFALLPDGKDPDELIRSVGAAAVQEVLAAAQPLADILWARETESADAATPERRAALERRVMDTLVPIRDETVRQHYREEMRARLKALFSRDRSGGVSSRAPQQAFQQYSSRSGSQQPWRRGNAGPTAGLVTTGVKDGALFRGTRSGLSGREALILAVVINHPAILDGHCEALAEIEFENAEADRLRGALLDCAAGDLREPAIIRATLDAAGFGRAVERIMAAASLHWWAQPGAAEPDVEQGFTHVVTLHRKMRTLHKEKIATSASCERDPTEENFAALTDILGQIAAIEGTEATIEGFGASSGRAGRSI